MCFRRGRVNDGGYGYGRVARPVRDKACLVRTDGMQINYQARINYSARPIIIKAPQ